MLEEIKIKQRYSALSVFYFRILKKFLQSKKEENQKWAVQELSKAFVKMIPQVLSGDKDNPLFPAPLLGGKTKQNVSNDNSAQKTVTIEEKD